ncbi:DNA polymerase III subunit alpha [Streptomyces sp. SID13666]|uniref:DNA polymerase III subunit alpha n=1 Tax=unclassified Streptomyces TaxID=2593676 RepID=UPI0013C1013B|nr:MULTISPECIES: DNA polymerase III subunit alpha [unclassified Streptomyces]NEA56449.1 DNA polymerase III subunit alpha [Streptomyces sp. SID13666]NEA75861.1 DNA polymerase III subunit alpha [Streptomyces sp. SID13588]
MSSFTHLHATSGYSARYGAAHVDHLVRRAAERGMGALALTDRDNVTGAVRFAKACDARGVRPIFGVDIAVAPHCEAPLGAQLRRRTPVRGGAHVVEAPLRVTLLAQNADGWARLCRLISAAYADTVAGLPVVSWSALGRHAGEGLTVLLGPVSEPVRALTAGREDLAEQLIAPWRDLAGDNLRMEVVWFGLQGTGPGSLRLAGRTLTLADRLTIPAVLTNAVRYADRDQHRLADVLDAARLLRPIDRRRLDTGERWLKDAASMTAAADRIAEAAGAGPERAQQLMAETAGTAVRCRVDPVADLGLGTPHFPEPGVVGAGTGPAEAAALLRERCEAGMVRRGLDRDPAAVQRLQEELAVIAGLQYDTYFLTVAAVVADVREMGIRVAARGSGAGSMVNHALYIATANPLEHHLLFERFLNPRRTSLPDIDIDVESARRLDVYDRIIERFGTDRVAVTGMPETYRARHALRDTGMALGIAPHTVDRIAKSFPHIRACDITSAMAELPELRELAAVAGQFGPLWELAEGLDALPRGMAMHPCGVIVSNATLLNRLPVQPTPGGYPMVQADKEDVEDLGLIKLDVLGVRMQSAMAHAVTEIQRTTGQHIDLDDSHQVPLDDFFAFKLIQASDTIGLFQLESPGQQDLLARLQPRDPQDVIADISLFRPGPVAGGMPAQYIAARHGAAPAYPHPDLEPVLADTYGVTIWHEQIIDMLATLTGCDRSLAEIARRALGDKNRLPKLRDWFLREAGARGYTPAVLDEVWEIIESFGAYGFCRAHAVAFAVPALQSAWLKAHHPAALYAGLLEHDPGMWPKRVIVADARRHNVPILSVDVNHSQATHTVEPMPDGTWGVRLALSAVKGISDDQVARLVAAQPYASLQDVWQRARPARPTVERLAEVGALDALRGSLTRRDLLLQIAELHRHARGHQGDGQLPLQDISTSSAPSGLPEMTGREALGAELETLSIDVSQHLMEHHHRLLREVGATDAAHLGALESGQTVLVAGVRASTQTPPIASGKRIIFVTLEDGSGLVDLAFFEDSHAACAHTIFHSGLLLVRGTVQRRGPRRTVVGTLVWDLEALAAARRDDGPEAVLRLLGDTTRPESTPAQPPQRTLANGTSGATLHPWADLQPAGTRSANLTRLGHTSPGSAGG